MRKWLRRLVILALLTGMGTAVICWWRNANVSPVERGRVIAYRHGCFGCHGPDGTRGIPNPGSPEKKVPSWDGGMMMMYANNEEELREWIVDGGPASRRKLPDWEKEHASWLVRMPAFRGTLSERDLADVVAFVKAVSDFDSPDTDLARKGRDEAAEHGCFGCHGPGGRGSMPNAGSFKGHIPAWNGPEFPELAANEAEIREWILDGVSKRIAQHPVGGYFVRHQRVPMPAFRGKLADEDVNAIVAYIAWMRRKS